MDATLDECEKRLHQHRERLEEQLQLTNEAIQSIQKAKTLLKVSDQFPISEIKQLIDNAFNAANVDKEGKSVEAEPSSGILSSDIISAANEGKVDNSLSNDEAPSDVYQSSEAEVELIPQDENIIEVEADTDLVIDSCIDAHVVGSLSRTNGMFYCSPIDSRKRDRELPILSDKIKKRCVQDPSLIVCKMDDEEGLMYSQFCRSNRMYLRCIIEKKVDDVKCVVRHVDFGTTEMVPITALSKLPLELYSDPPHFSLKCCLFKDMPAVPYEAIWCFKDYTDNADLSLTVSDIIEHDGGKMFVVDLETKDSKRILINDRVAVHAFKKHDPNDQPIQMKQTAQPEEEKEEQQVASNEHNASDEEIATLNVPLTKSSTLSWGEQCETSDSENAEQDNDKDDEIPIATDAANTEDLFESCQSSCSPTPPLTEKADSLGKQPLSSSIDEWAEDGSNPCINKGSQSGSIPSVKDSDSSISTSKISHKGDVRGGIIPAMEWSEEQLTQIKESKILNADARYFLIKKPYRTVHDTIDKGRLFIHLDKSEKFKKVCQNHHSSPVFAFLIGRKDKKKCHFCGIAQLTSRTQVATETRNDGSFRKSYYVEVEFICTAHLSRGWKENFHNCEEVPTNEAHRILKDVTYEIRGGRSVETLSVCRKLSDVSIDSTHPIRYDRPPHNPNPVAILKRGDTSWSAMQIKALSEPAIYDESTRFIQVITRPNKFKPVLRYHTYRIGSQWNSFFEKLMGNLPADQSVFVIFYMSEWDDTPVCGVGRIGHTLNKYVRYERQNVEFSITFLSTALSHQSPYKSIECCEITNEQGQCVVKAIINDVGKGSSQDVKELLHTGNFKSQHDRKSVYARSEALHRNFPALVLLEDTRKARINSSAAHLFILLHSCLPTALMHGNHDEARQTVHEPLNEKTQNLLKFVILSCTSSGNSPSKLCCWLISFIIPVSLFYSPKNRK